MNKRFVAATTMMAMFVTSAAAATAYQKSFTANYGISLEINGNQTRLTDINGKTVEPFTYNGTTYVPIRAVAENMGCYVGYDASSKTAIVYQDDTEAIVFAHKIAEADRQINTILDLLFSTCTLRRDGSISTTDAMSTIKGTADSVDSLMNTIESTYKILQSNNNIYIDDINDCIYALRNEYQVTANAVADAVSYVNAPSQALLNNVLKSKASIAYSKSAQYSANNFINSMWSYE